MKSLERDLETVKATFGRNAEALAKSLEVPCALEGELDQIRNVAQLVVSKVFGSAPSTSAPAIQLAKVLDEVWALITHGLFYKASGLLTSVAAYHPNLDFTTICSGYADGLSTEDIQSLRESLMPHARLVAEEVSAQWVMDVRREDMAESVCRGDVAQPTDFMGPGSKVDVVPPSAEPKVVPSGSEQPTSSPVAPIADATEPPQ